MLIFRTYDDFMLHKYYIISSQMKADQYTPQKSPDVAAYSHSAADSPKKLKSKNTPQNVC